MSEIEAQRRRRQQMDVTRHRLEEQMAEQLPNKRGYRKTGQDLSEEEQAAVDKVRRGGVCLPILEFNFFIADSIVVC